MTSSISIDVKGRVVDALAASLGRLVAVVALAAFGLIVMPSPSQANPTDDTPSFLHRFTEVPSDRVGFRKYVGITRPYVIQATLLGIYVEHAAPPAGAYGAVALTHKLFYYEKGLRTGGVELGESVLYVAASMKFPDELLKVP